MNSNFTDINTGALTFINKEAEDESWEQLRREFNTLFSNLRTENKEEGEPIHNETEEAKKPIILHDHDNSSSLNQRKTLNFSCNGNFKQVDNSNDMRKCHIKKVLQAKLIFNTLEGKEVFLKISQHTLGLISLLLRKAKFRVPILSSKLRSVALQLSIFRYLLRFGNFAVTLYRFIKTFREFREMDRSNFQKRLFFFCQKGFKFRDVIEFFYSLTDELILFEKLKIISYREQTLKTSVSKPTLFIKRQHNILWEVLNILDASKSILQWQKLMKDEIYLSLFNLSDNEKKKHKSEYKLLVSNKVNLNLQKNIVTWDFYKIIFNLLSNLINIMGKRREFKAGLTYEILSVSSGITDFIRLWNQARLALTKDCTSVC
ncbi:hypothetical protein GRS66_008134 [Saccharomyces pastorianus]|uniref:Uncharacterized protein n=2 Tax=Saccharomyces TaxID=4930 RepID=A0A6C1E8G5_SACPS|nr:hypothetical protein GRS66_008134 [Saccharomyces pastorianus]CAI2026832.1 hypothetical protein SEUBUCD650_0H02340 [Saccharomyces eubayanus]